MLRTSKTFREDWSQFLLESVGHQASPAFFQYVTHTLFKALIEMEYPVSDAQTETPHQILKSEEENALRYVAGYVCRKVRVNLEASSIPNKDDMILCVVRKKALRRELCPSD